MSGIFAPTVHELRLGGGGVSSVVDPELFLSDLAFQKVPDQVIPITNHISKIVFLMKTPFPSRPISDLDPGMDRSDC